MAISKFKYIILTKKGGVNMPAKRKKAAKRKAAPKKRKAAKRKAAPKKRKAAPKKKRKAAKRKKR